MKFSQFGLVLPLLIQAHLPGADNKCNCVERAKGILAAKTEIASELRRSGKDWNGWFAQLEPFRTDVAGKVEAAPLVKRAGFPLLRASGSPPIFMEAYLANYLLAKNQTLDEFVQSRPSVQTVISFDRWLKKKGIDLILVPVPRVVEVYPDRFSDKIPPSKIVGPHMRKLALDLLNADIEVLDLLPAFLRAANDGPPLYLATDPHWSGRAQELTAGIVAERLRRYPFVKQALSQKPAFTAKDIDANFDGGDFRGLDDTERGEVKEETHFRVAQVSFADGRIFQEPDKSPVLVIGDSFTHYFRDVIAKGTGIDALLSRDINLPAANISVGGATTEPIQDIIRDPEQQSTAKVIVWIIAEDNFTDIDRGHPLWLPIVYP